MPDNYMDPNEDRTFVLQSSFKLSKTELVAMKLTYSTYSGLFGFGCLGLS